jgi:hypothetical protein
LGLPELEEELELEVELEDELELELEEEELEDELELEEELEELLLDDDELLPAPGPPQADSTKPRLARPRIFKQPREDLFNAREDIFNEGAGSLNKKSRNITESRWQIR